MGGEMGAEIGLGHPLGDLVWIWQLLYMLHMGPHRWGPRSVQFAGSVPGGLPGLISETTL